MGGAWHNLGYSDIYPISDELILASKHGGFRRFMMPYNITEFEFASFCNYLSKNVAPMSEQEYRDFFKVDPPKDRLKKDPCEKNSFF